MKIIMVGMVAFLLSVNIQAQKKIQSRSKTNITTVKDSDGNKASNPNKRSGRGSKY
jgi:cytoskeletal protein RodZ